MNILNKNRKQRGVGLIEILIVLVVLVIGGAAIAALQGKLMSGSANSRAMATTTTLGGLPRWVIVL